VAYAKQNEEWREKQNEEWREGAGLKHLPLCELMAFLAGAEHVSTGTGGNCDNEREKTQQGACVWQIALSSGPSGVGGVEGICKLV